MGARAPGRWPSSAWRSAFRAEKGSTPTGGCCMTASTRSARCRLRAGTPTPVTIPSPACPARPTAAGAASSTGSTASIANCSACPSGRQATRIPNTGSCSKPPGPRSKTRRSRPPTWRAARRGCSSGFRNRTMAGSRWRVPRTPARSCRRAPVPPSPPAACRTPSICMGRACRSTRLARRRSSRSITPAARWRTANASWRSRRAST